MPSRAHGRAIPVTDMTKPADIARYVRNWQTEVDGAALYRAMASSEEDRALAAVYERLASVEERHAGFWEKRLAEAGHPAPARRPSWRARVLVWSARRWGAGAVLPTVASQEYVGQNDYVAQRETTGTTMTADERQHARVLRAAMAKTKGLAGSSLARLEGRHRVLGGNALRAAVLGANDGLCSNLSLVMGVAGATVTPRTVMLTGIAGLVAGAWSMALGEWVSVTSSRELARREVQIEKDELEASPEEEREELQLIYEAKGLDPKEAKELSARLLASPKQALDVLSREELGLDPEDLGGSPWVAAGSSMLLFSVGAFVPLAPFFLVDGRAVFAVSVAAGAAGLFVIGAAISIFTGRSALFSGGRQLLLGLAAAALTFAIGRLVGVAIGG